MLLLLLLKIRLCWRIVVIMRSRQQRSLVMLGRSAAA